MTDCELISPILSWDIIRIDILIDRPKTNMAALCSPFFPFRFCPLFRDSFVLIKVWSAYMQVLYAKNVLEVEALYCGSAESLVKCAALDTKCQKVCKDISSWSRIGEEVKMSGHYVQLCPNPLRFEPVTKENSVFFDEANRQVWRWAHIHTYTFHSWNLQQDLWERFPYNLIHLSCISLSTLFVSAICVK